ncbi:MAG: hypothetical protein ABJQ78_03370 [Alloalcanivorax sp.]
MSDLKEKNEKALMRRLLVAVVPIYISLAVSHGGHALQIVTSQPLAAFGQLAAIGIGPLLCLKVLLSLLSSVIDAHWKERLAHLRWNNPLPGSRCDQIMTKDARIDLSSLPPEVQALREESMTPKERNARWYRDIYRPARNDPAILNSHRQYLLNRDASAGVFLLILITGLTDLASRITIGAPLVLGAAYLALLIYLSLLMVAANVAGKRMVAGAIANFSNTQHIGGGQ